MKNFFKKLAFVLALAMVLVSVAPATANAAAKAPSLKKTSKILYIGGDITGTISDSYRFYFNNAKGYTATWESLNEDVVVIEGKEVVAVGVGKAVVRATLTNKAGNEVVREATVWVKQNAEKVGFGSTKAIDSPIELGAKVKVNVFRQVGDKKIWTQSDMATCTDKIVWTSSDEKVATVDKWGTVTAVGAGEATITATATQPQGPTAGESASYKVTVVSGLTGATQKNVNTVNLTFGTAVTKDKVNTTTVKLYEVVGSTKVLQLVSEVKVDEKDATKATLTSYVNFKKNTTYVVEFDGKTAEFVAVDPSVESVKEVRILTKEAVKAEATKVEYQLLTANGVDITSVIPAGRVSIELKGSDFWFNTTDNKVTFYDAGKVATVKVVFHTYTYATNGVENVIETEATIVSVDKKQTTLGTAVAWTLDDDNKFDFKKDTVNQKLAVNDKPAYFIGKYVDSNKNDVFTNKDGKFTFESSNKNVFMVNSTTANNETMVYPVSEGSATLIVKYDGVAIDAIAITVFPKRTAANVTYSVNKPVVSFGKGSDSITLTVEATDNYQEAVAGTKVNLSVLNTDVAGAGFVKGFNTEYVLDAKGKATINITGTDLSHVATYNIKIAVGDIYRVITISAKNPGEALGVKLNISKDSIDTTLKISTGSAINAPDSYQSTITLSNVDNNGLYVSDATINYGEPTTKPTSGLSYFYKFYDVKGNEITDGKIDGVQFLTNNTFSAVTNDAGYLKKAPTGTYKVAYYSINKDGVIAALGQSFITVKDDQPKATITQSKFESEFNNVDAALAAGEIEIKLNVNGVDQRLVKFTAKDLLGVGTGESESGRDILIKSVTYEATVTFGKDTTAKYLLKIDVSKNIKLK